MKKKSASQSAPARRNRGEGGFFNLRLLTGLFLVLAGVFLALMGFGGFSAQAQQKQNPNAKPSIDPLVPALFDCSRIRDLGIDRQENLRAGAIMIYCGEAAGGKPAPASVSQLIQRILEPDALGTTDTDLITGTETSPNVTQSETFTAGNPDNPLQILVGYNDSRGRNASPINISGASYSTDGGNTFTRLTAASGQSPFINTSGDPVVLYNRPTATWYTVWLDGGCGAQGLGGYKSTTPGDPSPASWTHFCVHTGGSDDRESGWSDTNSSSPFYGRMYVSWNDFAVGSGALFVAYTTDNGATWTNQRQLTTGTPFIRDVQITGDLATGVVYVAGVNENGGSFPHNNNNLFYRSTDGGNTWTNTYTGPTYAGPGRSASGYFATMYSSPAYWRHEGWGEPAALNGVVHYVYDAANGSDPADVFYIRSTDSGVTFSAPFMLNSNTDPTKAQWQPNLSVTASGTLMAMWYDERDRVAASCQPSSPSTPCYRMYARKSNDNGVTWLPDDTFSDVVSPLPLQPDPGIQAVYAGDYDYGSPLINQHLRSWTDGRVAIGGASQQDAFFDREPISAGLSVIGSNPACGGVVSTQPTDFVINVTDPVNPATLAGSDFTVNGTPANSVAYTAGQTTMTFHFNSTPVITQGLQTMHIAAGAFNRASDNNPVFDFTCTFRWDVLLLQVVSTVPAVNGTFTPDAPGTYQYDVNFNEAVDPTSVQTTDLTVSGNSGPSVTGVTVLAGNTTARFTLNMLFGGTLTANIAAGAITDGFGNPNAAFAGNYSVTGCPPQNHYNIAQIGGSIVPGTTDIGNHTDDGVTTISLPFSYALYGTSYSSINVSSNGTAQFVTTDVAYTNVCLPWTTHNSTIFPYWDDQRTDAQTGCSVYPGGTCGIFTSTSGSTPNRVFNIEWRAVYYNTVSQVANHELRLYEGQSRFDVIYGTVDQGNTSATAGVQKDDITFDQYFCNATGSAATGGQSYTLQFCGTPSPTPTATATSTGTPSPTPTATATSTTTPTVTATATATVAATATPSPGCANYVISNASGSIVSGTTDIGNHTDDGNTLVTLPFPITLYGNTYTTANAGSNGYLSFGSFINSFYSGCLPNASFTYTIFPFETDQITFPTGMGIFTVTTGTTPNRTFYIEWRSCHYSTATTCLANTNSNYEIVFQEGSSDFSIVYGTFDSGNAAYGAIGVQGTSGVLTQSQCNLGAPGSTKQIYAQCLFGTPTSSPTPTATSTATATVPPSPTPTATATVPPSPTPTPTPSPSPSPCLNYTYSVATGAIVPGVTDTGNHVDDASTIIALPFSYQLYEQTFGSVAVGSNGHLTFGAVIDSFNATCLPQATTTYAIFPYRTDLCTNACTGNTGTTYGIFTSISGTAPNRIFNIEWRTAYYNSADTTVNFEVRLFEGQTAFDVIYGTVNPKSTANDGPLSVGVQRTDTANYTLVGCDTTGGQFPPVSTGQLYHYTLGIVCPSPTPTATATGTATATATASPTPTATATATLAPSPTPAVTPTPPCPNPTNVFFENFDGVTVPALPAGWTAANAVDPDGILCVTSNSGLPTPVADSTPNSAFINDPAVVSDKRLDTPLIAITSTSARVSFRNNYALEPIGGGTFYFDGGVLEVSSPNINAGAFTDITAAAVGGSFITGGYNGTISTNFSNPIGGRMAWSQSSGGFISTLANLGPNVAGQTIKLRFRMCSDSSVAANGWRIDDVTVIDCLASSTPTPASTPTPTPTPTSTVPPTVSISGTVTYCTNPAIPPIPGVTMTLTGTSGGSTTTNGSGNYLFSGLTSGGSYTVTPTKTGFTPGSNGINTVDVIAVQRHFLMIGTPLSGCKLLAADVNGVGGINTVDVIAIQRFFLVLSTGIANCGKYQFTPVSRSYAPLNINQTSQNYDTIVFGDVATTYVH